MLEICMLASGSSGNAVYVATEKTRLLIDAGISCRRITRALSGLNVDPATLDGLLVSHDHNDHACGIGVIARRHRIPVYATPLTWQAVDGRCGALPPAARMVMPRRGRLKFRDLTVETFPTPHDAADPVGFLFQNGSCTAALVTDLGCMTGEILEIMRSVRCLVLEANHDEQMLIKGTYPWPLKKRILGERGHLSNDSAADSIATAVTSLTTHIVLAHLSEENNTPQLAEAAVSKKLKLSGRTPGHDISVMVADRHNPSCHVRLAQV